MPETPIQVQGCRRLAKPVPFGLGRLRWINEGLLCHLRLRMGMIGSNLGLINMGVRSRMFSSVLHQSTPHSARNLY
ncbi:MAG: hypothetical protein WCD18_09075 [Thermosynechococcaceae cyanobacterium]